MAGNGGNIATSRSLAHNPAKPNPAKSHTNPRRNQNLFHFFPLSFYDFRLMFCFQTLCTTVVTTPHMRKSCSGPTPITG